MMENRGFSLPNMLKERARKLAGQGFSVIPVLGNALPEQPKKPAIMWREYQQRIATPAEIDGIFRGEFTAIGIVCGRVSRLVVIDFDDLVGYRSFCGRFPEIAETYCVKTRRGFHLYYLTDQKVPSHQFDGGDIKGEKSYVLAPPSEIGGLRYETVREMSPLELSGGEMNEILNFLQSTTGSRHVVAMMPRGNQLIDLSALYKRLARQIGRNNALYRCASIARDQGMMQADADVELNHLHVLQVGKDGERRESAAVRWLEAKRTIASAFARGHGRSMYGLGVPNSVREFLLREQGKTVLARLLDAFGMEGWRADDWFALKEGIALGEKYGLNRKSVLEALNGEASVYDGGHIIRRRYVEYLDNRGLNSRGRGRPCQIAYQVPSPGELVSMFGARWTPSDPLVANDLKSAHNYRLALHREYIRRLQPEVPMSWLARRIGVNVRTIQRYNQELGIGVVETVGSLDLVRRLLYCLPKKRVKDGKNVTKGFWLQLEDGRRFPAWRHVGSWLLKNVEGKLKLCVRLPSQYLLASAVAVAKVVPLSAGEVVRVLGRRGVGVAEFGVGSAVRNLVDLVRTYGVKGGMRVPLQFDNVVRHIANDKVAESIRAYVYALGPDGKRIARPARRGVAYRMLSEFGEGNVFLAVMERASDTLLALTRHWLRLGQPEKAMDFLMRALE